MVEFGFQVGGKFERRMVELAQNAERRFGLEVHNLALTLNNQADSHRLHTACRQRRFNLLPKNWRQLETDQTVENAARLLCVDQIDIDATRIFDGVQNGRFCNFVENNSFSRFVFQPQHFVKVPRNGFSLTVLIGCEPYGLCIFGGFFQIGYKLFLVGRNLVFRFILMLDVDAEAFFGQIADVSVTRRHHIIFAQKLFNSLGLGW